MIEDCLNLLREIELQLAAGSDVATACRSAECLTVGHRESKCLSRFGDRWIAGARGWCFSNVVLIEVMQLEHHGRKNEMCIQGFIQPSETRCYRLLALNMLAQDILPKAVD